MYARWSIPVAAQEMSGQELVPNLVVCNAALAALKAAGKVAEAEQLLERTGGSWEGGFGRGSWWTLRVYFYFANPLLFRVSFLRYGCKIDSRYPWRGGRRL